MMTNITTKTIETVINEWVMQTWDTVMSKLVTAVIKDHQSHLTFSLDSTDLWEANFVELCQNAFNDPVAMQLLEMLAKTNLWVSITPTSVVISNRTKHK